MKRVFIVLKDITESGGGERVCVNLANALSSASYEITIISFFRRHEAIAFELDSNIKVLFLSQTSTNTKNPFKKLYLKSVYRRLLCSRTDSIIREQKPNAILANDGWYIPQTRIDSINYVRLWHLNAPKRVNKRKRDIFAKFDTLAILSGYELATWQSCHSNIKIIPNFLPRISETSTDYKQRHIISVGRMDRGDQKGFVRLVDIWGIVQEKIARNTQENMQDWQLVVVGSGSMKEEIEAKTQEKNLQDSLILKPFTKEIESEYLSASIYAMSSHFEGFPMVLVEASSLGLPCIAFDVATGPSDIIDSESSGYLIKDNDLEAYADKLLMLMSDETKRKEMGTNAKQRVAKHFSKEAILPLWQEIL